MSDYKFRFSRSKVLLEVWFDLALLGALPYAFSPLE